MTQTPFASLPAGGSALIVGATGAIGGALSARAVDSGRFEQVFGSSRGGTSTPSGATPLILDLEDETTIADAAAQLAKAPALRLLIVATGVLQGDGFTPEKGLKALDPSAMARLFALNTIGPAMVLKHFAPLLARDGKAVLAVLSARVGSLEDNRLGGWHSYRASKAALNMILRNAAIEVSRSRPEAVCLALHPGTVDSSLSAPFQKGVPAEKLFSPERSADCLIATIDARGPADSGGFFDWRNTAIAW
jgi:NAD(P)-dependent dehydrogenase (short-subunit alcohol dehydrogenase family)